MWIGRYVFNCLTGTQIAMETLLDTRARLLPNPIEVWPAAVLRRGGEGCVCLFLPTTCPFDLQGFWIVRSFMWVWWFILFRCGCNSSICWNIFQPESWAPTGVFKEYPALKFVVLFILLLVLNFGSPGVDLIRVRVRSSAQVRPESVRV